MANNKKLTNQYCINVNDETAQLIERIAEHEQRKPAELLRLLLAPVLRAEFVKIQREEHQENTEPMQKAIFRN